MNRSRHEVEKWWLKLSDWHMEFISIIQSTLCMFKILCLKKKHEMVVLTYIWERSHAYIYTHRHIPGSGGVLHLDPLKSWFYHTCLTIHLQGREGFNICQFIQHFSLIWAFGWSHFCSFLVSKWELHNWNTSPLHWDCQ